VQAHETIDGDCCHSLLACAKSRRVRLLPFQRVFDADIRERVRARVDKVDGHQRSRGCIGIWRFLAAGAGCVGELMLNENRHASQRTHELGSEHNAPEGAQDARPRRVRQHQVRGETVDRVHVTQARRGRLGTHDRRVSEQVCVLLHDLELQQSLPDTWVRDSRPGAPNLEGAGLPGQIILDRGEGLAARVSIVDAVLG
jgi:hypothetical protein